MNSTKFHILVFATLSLTNGLVLRGKISALPTSLGNHQKYNNLHFGLVPSDLNFGDLKKSDISQPQTDFMLSQIDPIPCRNIRSNLDFDLAADVKQLISDQLEVSASKVTDEASFIDDLGADDLAVVELVLAAEERYECTIPDAENLRLVIDLINSVKKYCSHN